MLYALFTMFLIFNHSFTHASLENITRESIEPQTFEELCLNNDASNILKEVAFYSNYRPLKYCLLDVYRQRIHEMFLATEEIQQLFLYAGIPINHYYTRDIAQLETTYRTIHNKAVMPQDLKRALLEYSINQKDVLYREFSTEALVGLSYFVKKYPVDHLYFVWNWAYNKHESRLAYLNTCFTTIYKDKCRNNNEELIFLSN